MEVYERILKAVRGEELDRLPEVLWAIGQSFAPAGEVADNLYYSNPETMLKAQLKFFEKFPKIFTIPGLWPDFGAIPEAASFGCKVEFPKDSPPTISRTRITSLEQVDELTVCDPKEAEYTKRVLDYLSYFKANAPAYLLREMGFLDGHIFLGGPIEISCMIAGYEEFLLGTLTDPDNITKLLDKVLQFLLKYIAAVEEILGPIKRIIMFEHTVGMTGENVFLEYQLPYINKVFDACKDAELRIYHNENNWNHLIPHMNKINCNVIHCGPDFDWNEGNKHIDCCIMGNLNPMTVLADKSEEEIAGEVERILKIANRKTKLWFSTGGGMVPSTSDKKIRAMINAVRKYGKLPCEG
jgi:uroporphyrinogen-III decarboxylase